MCQILSFLDCEFPDIQTVQLRASLFWDIVLCYLVFFLVFQDHVMDLENTEQQTPNDRVQHPCKAKISVSLTVVITVVRLTEYVSEIGYNTSFLVQKPVQQSSAVKSQSSAVAAAFNLDEEEEPEEMPPEARMRMRNIGRYE